MHTMMNSTSGATRRRRSWSLLLPAILMLPEAVAAQPASTRDSGRVYRLQIRNGDTNYVQSIRITRQQLVDRLDSLRREFEGLGPDAPDRRDLSRELRSLITSLTQLTLLEQGTRPRIRFSETPEALAEGQVFAAPLRRMTSLQPGWIGINTEAPHTRMIVRSDSAYIRYFGYPEIVSVEPNSPAERAGIMRGDRLLAYDGADLREREINLTRLLQPSRRLTITVRRDGEERQVTVIVTKPPPQVMMRRQMPLPESTSEAPSPPTVVIPRTAIAPRALAGTRVFVFDPMDAERAPVAGAKLTEIHGDELGHIFGVSSGVLVTEVFSDPARSSGLRGGDVIIAADGQDITSVAQLRRVVAAHNTDRAVELEIMRQKRTRSLTLRW